jgi:hypothetical protein
MYKLVTHMRLIDSLDAQLDQAATFKELYWHRHDVSAMCRQTHELFEGQQRHTLALVRVLNGGLHNVTSLCPEEQKVIGKELFTMAESMLRNIMLNVEEKLKQITSKTAVLRNLCDENAVLQRMQQPASSSLPGTESEWRSRASVASIANWRQAVSDVCSSIARTDSITIYSILFVPREYLYESMTANIRAALRSMAIIKQGEVSLIGRPTKILKHFRDCMYSYSTVEQSLPINLSDIFRDVLLSELGDDSAEAAGASYVYEDTQKTVGTDKAPQEGLIASITRWYGFLFRPTLF